MTYDPLYVEYLYYFNIAQDYYECHEVMEHLWLEEGRSPLYQGLLQVAVGLHHHQHDNISGAIKLFTAGIEKLEPYEGDAGLGIDLQGLIATSKQYLARLEQDEAQHLYDPFLIRIHDEELVRAVEVLREHPPDPHED